jgi:hypothetical protein
MKSDLREFKTGWYGVSLAFRADEIVDLIEALNSLKSGKIGHFHFRSDFSGIGGIADIEISLSGSDEKGDLKLD